MRRMRVHEWWRKKDAHFTAPFEKRLVGTGNFIQYGLDYEERESGVGIYSTAIVEFDDGTVANAAIDLVEFIV
jgi:hypothetical protein